jgi:hypothetical protein
MLKHYLWKEWRDHRSILIGIVLAVPFLLAICGWALPTDVLKDKLFPATAAFATFFIAVLAVAADVVPGEARRGTLGFLRRLPAGLTPPFWAKALFTALVLFTLALYGYGVAIYTAHWAAGDATAPDGRILWFAPVAVAIAAWVFVVSCWLPRGALAVPATALVLGLGLLPVKLIVEENPWIVPVQGWPVWPAWAFAAAAPLVAWFSFVGGQRVERGVRHSAWRGVAVTLLLFVPVWAATKHEATRMARFDPDEPFMIQRCTVAEGGKTAYVNVRTLRPRMPYHGLAVDLATGRWRALGKPGTTVGPVWFVPHDARPARVVVVEGRMQSRRDDEHFGQAWCHYLDARTGELIEEGWSAEPGTPTMERARKWRAPAEGWRFVGRRGLGTRLWNQEGGMVIHDPFRDRMYPEADYESCHDFAVRPGKWLARRERRLVLLDPETGEVTDVKGLDPKRSYTALLPDGRVLTIDWTTREIVLVDPETGKRDGLGVHTNGTNKYSPGMYYLGAPLMFRIHTGDAVHVARLDPETGKFTYAKGLEHPGPYIRFQLSAVLDDGAIVGIDEDRRVVRARFGTDDLEVLFPR